MELITMILLTVVILAQAVLFTLHFLEKNRNDRRYHALLSYIDLEIEVKISDVEESTGKLMGDFGKKIDERFTTQRAEAAKRNEELLQTFHSALDETKSAVSSQLNGMMLDYTQAQEAANKINDFGASLANIFDYDPIKAIQKGRNKEAS